VNQEIPKDTLLQSREAKSFFFSRCDQLQLDPFDVARYAGVKKEVFASWINAVDVPTMMNTVTQEQAYIMFESVGIVPVLHFVVTDTDNFSAQQKAVVSSIKHGGVYGQS
jgi:hypothetical protein